ncbi:hypothetical protein [Desulfopila sp. IMCC35008]|uniref:hypothetical protein n=1 Tax=Desulfopila sp. IMCC35008 TaxID=2653858 RepID=UPI001F0F1672|nr:hypothetical protein [Desulfopila sp. IMCC35008]
MSQRKFKRAQQKQQKDPQPVTQPPQSQPSVQAMVWYKEEHWDTLKLMFVDGDRLPPTYEEWHKRAEEMKKQAQASGDAVIKVFIDPETFPEWCAQKGVEMDSEARSQLAIEVAQEQSFSL